MAGSSHVYSDGSAGFFRFLVSDGTHSHTQRVHTSISNIDNTADPGSPVSPATLIAAEVAVNCTARNYLSFAALLTATSYQVSLLDFQPVSGGIPVGAPESLLPYAIAATGGGPLYPEAEISYTFRDTEGAPMRFVFFGGSATWNAATRPNNVANWASNVNTQFAAYITGTARSSGTALPAGLTRVCSHHGLPASVPLHIVSGLNNRLRRAYHVK